MKFFSRIRHWLDEFFYLFFCQIALILITGIDFTIHEVLYNYSLRFDYNWANPYWIILTALFWAIAAVGTAKIADNAVTAGKIPNSEIPDVKIVPKSFVKAHGGAGLSKVLQHGYDAVTGELVLVVDDVPNP